MSLIIKSTPVFGKSIKKLAKKYKNIKQDYQKLLEILSTGSHNATNLGDDFYKIRLQNSSNNQGKSGGFRVVYFFKTKDNEIYLLDIYSKNDVQTIDKTQLMRLTKTYNL